jgi:glycosyltransferase involved in cell wall biosynthesis
MTSQPLITFGVTCFNAEETIQNALLSALNQTWENFEIIVVDDCSTDKSVQVIETYKKQYDQIKLIQHKENKGVAAARNTILNNANGEFLAFFDDDDQSIDERISIQYKKLVAYEKFSGVKNIICHSARVQKFPNKEKRYEPTLYSYNLEDTPKGTVVADMILIGRPIGVPIGSMATCSQMAKLSTYQSVGGFNEKLRRSEDTDLNVRLGLSGAHFLGVADPLVHQTMTISPDKLVSEERRNALEWLRNHRSYLEKIGWWKHTIKWVDIKFDYLSGQKTKFLMRMIVLSFQFPIKTGKRLWWASMNRRRNS